MRTKTVATVLLCVLAIISLGLPLLYLFAPSGVVPGSGPLFSLYAPLVTLFDEKAARVMFCGAWFLLDAGLVWQLLLSRRKDVDTSPVDGLAD